MKYLSLTKIFATKQLHALDDLLDVLHKFIKEKLVCRVNGTFLRVDLEKDRTRDHSVKNTIGNLYESASHS